VLIGLKTTANDQFPKLLPPLVGPQTAVVTLQNGLGNAEQLARLFSPEQILSGLCFVCLNRLEPGVIHHLKYGTIVLGEFQRRAGPRTQKLAEMFRDTSVPCKVTDNLAQAQWEKLVWNIPFNGLGVAGAASYEIFATRHPPAVPKLLSEGWSPVTCHSPGPVLTTNKLLGDPRWEKILRDLMLEVIAAAGALGFEIPVSYAEEQIERTRTMGAYKASTLLDFELGRPLELESMFLEPLRRAQQAGVPVPRLTALCAVLQQLDQSH
jgi:2-dehydropantoate 2-reductase